jgi:hypothetical protein
LNLILLRAYLSSQDCILDESALDAGDRPWDRLTALWRSWFTPESLGTLATQFTATRAGTLITLEPVRSELTVGAGTALHTAYNAATALADNLTAASAGLHVISLNELSEDFIKALLDSIPVGDDLTHIADLIRVRTYGSDPSHAADRMPEALKFVTPRGPELMLLVSELIDRTCIAPGHGDLAVPLADMKRMVQLSRYQAELLIHACVRLDPLWMEGFLPDQTFRPDPLQPTIPTVYSSFLMSAAAAPTFRTAVQQMSADQCADLAKTIMERTTGLEIKLFDVDTAAAFAVLAWRGSVAELFLRVIDAILQECQQGRWRLMRIPLETWPNLADALITADPAIQSRRQEFAAILREELAQLSPGLLGRPGRREFEFRFHAYRIISLKNAARSLVALFTQSTSDHAGSLAALRWFLLLVRWARENNEAKTVEELLSSTFDRSRQWWTHFGASVDAGPATIDLDRASADLSYREAMDLRWAIDAWNSPAAAGSLNPARLLAPGQPPAHRSPRKRRSGH